jgi:hypothetical protein
MDTIDENSEVQNTVVAKTNEQNTRKNYDKTIVFALMGEKFSFKFVKCWMETFNFCIENGIRPLMSFSGEVEQSVMRNSLIGGSMNNGIDQKPFGGNLNYDYIMWIDSDTLFTHKQIEMLVQGMEKYDIVSGASLDTGMKHYNAIVNTDLDVLRENGKFDNVPKEMLESLTESENPYLKVDYVDLGFVMIKKGVIERFEYPWFHHETCHLVKENKVYAENYSVPHTFCQNLKKKGYDIMIDSRALVKREYNVVF